MKKLKQIIAEINANKDRSPDELTEILWQLICYSPKMGARLQQRQLLDEAEKFTLTVQDDHFAKRELSFHGFKWGKGKKKILITHGWGSKAADFTELITALKEIDDVQVIAFDAPGNGSSEGELSNLLLFVEAVRAIVAEYGTPDVAIGHSLGGMANMMALQEEEKKPELLISIAPLIRLKENFEASMNAVAIPAEAQAGFLKSFEELFGNPASYYNVNKLYALNGAIDHRVFYDKDDQVSTYNYLEEFLNGHPAVKRQEYEAVGHERIIKSPMVISEVAALVAGL